MGSASISWSFIVIFIQKHIIRGRDRNKRKHGIKRSKGKTKREKNGRNAVKGWRERLKDRQKNRYIGRQTIRQKERQKDRATERHGERKTENRATKRQKDRGTERQSDRKIE